MLSKAMTGGLHKAGFYTVCKLNTAFDGSSIWKKKLTLKYASSECMKLAFRQLCIPAGGKGDTQHGKSALCNALWIKCLNYNTRDVQTVSGRFLTQK